MAGIDGLPTSSQREAFGASGGILSTGFDRIFGKNKKDAPVSLEPEAKFKNFLIEMIESQGLSEVNEKRERRPLEEELLYQEELKRISDKRLSAVTKTQKKERREKKEEETREEGAGTGAAPAEYMSTAERVKAIEEVLIKDYVALTAKKMVGRPRDILDNVNIRLVEVQNRLIEQGLTPSDFSYLDQKTIDLIKESFLHLIKDRFFRSSDSPMGMIDWILTAKTGRSIFEMLNMLEKDSLSLSDKARLLSTFDIPDLLDLSEKLNVDIDGWMSGLTEGKISIEGRQGLDMYFHAVEQAAVREATLLVERYRASETNIFLEDSFIKRFRLRMDSMGIRRELSRIGIDRKEADGIKAQARKIAWVRTVSHLKENHLVRILTTSSEEFDRASVNIEKLTGKAKKLGYDIPKEGVKWIETGLTKLAHETALYKLELLKSLQKLSFEKKREGDISRLGKIIHDLGKKLVAK